MTLLDTDALDAALAEPDWNHRLVVTPMLESTQVTEASIDLRLGNDFLVMRRSLGGGIDVSGTWGATVLTGDQLQAEIDSLYEPTTVSFGEGFWLHPQQFALAATLEFIRLPPTLGGYVLSRSTWGRLGLLVATAITVQPGFAGALTLELVNESDSPVKLYPGLKIAQLTVQALPGSAREVRQTASEEETKGAEETGGTEARQPTYRWPTGPQPARIVKEHAELDRIRKLGKALAGI